MKTLKIICLVLLSMLALAGEVFSAGKDDTIDFEAEYTGRIITSDRNFLLVMITEPETYSGIQIRDKQGFIVDGDVVQGKLCLFGMTTVISDTTQDSKFTGVSRFITHSWDDVERWWRLRYDLRYPN